MQTSNNVKERLAELLTEISRNADRGYIVNVQANQVQKTGWNYSERKGEIMQTKGMTTLTLRVSVIH